MGVKWGKAARCLSRHGLCMVRDGGDVLIYPPRESGRKGTPIRIGHHYCTKNSAELPEPHLKKIERDLGIDRETMRRGDGPGEG